MPPPSIANNFFGPRFFRRSGKEILLRIDLFAMTWSDRHVRTAMPKTYQIFAGLRETSFLHLTGEVDALRYLARCRYRRDG